MNADFTAKGRVRVVGCNGSESLKVERIFETPDAGTVNIGDGIWTGDVPLHLVPVDLRMPNSEFIILVEDRFVITGIERIKA